MGNDYFSGKTAIVTGGASGIGLETAKVFLERGANVVIADLKPEHLKDAEKKLGPQNLLASVCDVSFEADVTRTMDEAEKRFGKVDIIVNNAGLMIFKPFVEHTLADWTKVLGVDLIGAF
jgi:NAD(P)-dependent dehydrogenase (short-subunit alcohol dehydrogenase family)